MWVLSLMVMIMLFENATFTDIPHRHWRELQSLTEKWWSWRLQCVPCTEHAQIQGTLLSYIVLVVVLVNSEDCHSSVKLVLYMDVNYSLFLLLMLYRIKKKNLAVRRS